MAAKTVRALIDQAEEILQDAGNDAWGESDLVKWYNHAASQAVTLEDKANTVIEPVKLAAGTLQYIPARGLKFLRVTRNMGTDGKTAGEAVTFCTLAVLETWNRNWNTATASVAIIHYMPHTDTAWYCYPPSDGTGYVEEQFSQVPPVIVWDEDGAWENALVGVDDAYVDPVLQFMLAYAFMKDTDFPGNMQRALNHHNLALQGLGLPQAKNLPPGQ
jgi:hypothetical protein